MRVNHYAFANLPSRCAKESVSAVRRVKLSMLPLVPARTNRPARYLGYARLRTAGLEGVTPPFWQRRALYLMLARPMELLQRTQVPTVAQWELLIAGAALLVFNVVRAAVFPSVPPLHLGMLRLVRACLTIALSVPLAPVVASGLPAARCLANLLCAEHLTRLGARRVDFAAVTAAAGPIGPRSA